MERLAIMEAEGVPDAERLARQDVAECRRREEQRQICIFDSESL